MKRFVPVLCVAALLTAGVVAAQPGHRFHGGFDRAGGPAAGMIPQRAVDKLTQSLALSQAQQASWQQLRNRLQTTVQPLFDAARQKHEAIRDGLENNADAASLGNLMIEAHQIGKQIRAAHDQYERDFTALLTPEQATKYQSFREMRDQFRHGFGGGPEGAPEPPPGS
jgi:Spy/CpxP family protein refolding chaperone